MSYEPPFHWEPDDTEHNPECDANKEGVLPCNCVELKEDAHSQHVHNSDA